MRKTWLFAAILVACGALADEPASLQGTVTDTSQAALPGCTVTITDGKLTRETTTDGNGRYAFAGLAAGNYEVSFSLAGTTQPKREQIAVRGGITTLSAVLQFVIIDDIFLNCGPPCSEEKPETQFEQSSCADYNLNTSLIEAAAKRDRSAVELLQRRYAETLSWQERARIAGALLGRIANDDEIWKELEQHAENLVRFSNDDEETKAKLEAWCGERGYDAQDYLGVAFFSFDAASSDRRSRPLLVRAIASSNRDVVMNAIYGFGKQVDESALPLIEEALARFDSPASMAELLALYHSDAADQVAMKYITDEDDRANYREMRQQP